MNPKTHSLREIYPPGIHPQSQLICAVSTLVLYLVQFLCAFRFLLDRIIIPTAPSLLTADSFEMASSNDRAILLEFFHATNGPSWKDKYGLNTNFFGRISTRYGVTVDKDGRVVGLWLPDNNLTGNVSLGI